MNKRLAIQFSLVLALAAPVAALAQDNAPAARSGEPTIDDIYKAAESGRLTDADGMIAKVLTAHPGSAKAHFVHAELLSKEGKLGAAKSEFAKAKELAPGLPFAKPEAVASLTQRIEGSAQTQSFGFPSQRASSTTSSSSSSAAAAPGYSASGMGTPAKLGILALLIGAGIFMFRRIRNQAPMPQPGMPGPAGYGAQNYAGPGGYAPAGMNPGYPPATTGPLGGGLGSALMTGAAVGLGAVAVEEAVRHFSHRDTPANDVAAEHRNIPPGFGDLGPDLNADMGGNDFGISDTGSWDSGGGDDGSGW